MAPTSLTRLRVGSAAKLGRNAKGHIHYALLCDAAHEALFIQITGNDGGGYVSREAVPFAAIAAVSSSQPAGQPLRSRAFATCFKGRSSNNPGFLACILVAEGLLTAEGDLSPALTPAGDWSAWAQAARELPGESIDGESASIQIQPAKPSKKARNTKAGGEHAAGP